MVRQHILALVTVPAIASLFRYVIVFANGQADRFASALPIPFLDLWIEIGIVALSAFVCLLRPALLPLLRMAMQLLVAISVIVLLGVIALRFSNFSRSALQLVQLISDPVWGATLLLVVVVVFARSLFQGIPRLFLAFIVSFITLRIVLYAGLAGQIRPVDATITHSGNRILLYIWPVLMYWLSCSEELVRLFSFRPLLSVRPTHQDA